MANNIIKRVWNQGSMTPIEDLQGSAFTNENGGHTFQISGVDSNGEALALSGTVAASFLRPDQTTVGISGSVSGGVASVTLSEECYGIPGRFGLVVFLTSDGKKTAIYSCVGNVARSSTDAVAPGVTADVVDLINEIETAVGTIPASYSALMADIAPTYSTSALYAVGDYAWYEGDLKRCIVPITVGETYTPAHWTSAVVGDDVCALKSAFNPVADSTLVLKTKGIDYSSNYYKTVYGLTKDETYMLKVTVGTAGTYSLTSNSNYSSSNKVDDIFTNIGLEANTPYYHKFYTPSADTIKCLRLSSSITWSVEIYRIVNEKEIIENISKDTEMFCDFLADGTDISPASTSWKQIPELSTEKVYAIKVKPNSDGIFFAKTATMYNNQSIVDTLFEGKVVKSSDWETVYYYTPSESGIKYILMQQDSCGVGFSVKVYEMMSAFDLQKKLVSSQNIKTINGESILGSGNLVIQGGGTTVDGNVDYEASVTIKLGTEFITNDFSLGTGWSGSNASGYTHTSGNTDPLVYATSTEENEVYILEFDSTYYSDEFATVGIGDMYKILVYNGTSHIIVPLLSDGGQLKIVPYTTFSGTISNLTMKKVSSEGTDKTLALYNMLTTNHTQNYGFWNVLLGNQVAQNGVGIARTIAIGCYALQNIQGGHRNIAIGTYAMNTATGAEHNVSIGADNMMSVKEAYDCISLGFGTMHHGNVMKHNIAIGSGALANNGDHDSTGNVAIGKDAGYKTYGNTNVSIGYEAGTSITSGVGNIVIGNGADAQSNQNQNVVIGNGAKSGSNVSRSIAIGFQAQTTASYQMMLGSTSITEVVMCGNKKINFNNDGTVTWEEIT